MDALATKLCALSDAIFPLPADLVLTTAYTNSIGAAMFSWAIVLVGATLLLGGILGAMMKYLGITSIVDKLYGLVGIGGDSGGMMGGIGGGAGNMLESISANYLQSFIGGVVLISMAGLFGYILNLLVRVLFAIGAAALGGSCSVM